MAFASILVHAGLDRMSDPRIQLAVDLADGFNATLIGVAGWDKILPVVTPDGTIADGKMAERYYDEIIARLVQREKQFRVLAGRARKPVEWRSAAEFPTDFIAREARAGDLLIIGQELGPRDLHRTVDPAGLLLRAGRPVLVVPDNATFLRAKRIAIAWKDTREARRAIQDSLPFLLEAEAIYIIGVCEEGTEEETQQQIADVRQYLVRHRITTTTGVVLRLDEDATRPLMRVVRNENIDLLVAGAYGHSRFGEWAFGGVTRDLLRTCPICCLLSH